MVDLDHLRLDARGSVQSEGGVIGIHGHRLPLLRHRVHGRALYPAVAKGRRGRIGGPEDVQDRDGDLFRRPLVCVCGALLVEFDQHRRRSKSTAG